MAAFDSSEPPSLRHLCIVASMAPPVPRLHIATRSMPKDLANPPSHEDGCGTPLPQYEKTQSVPFTLTLQEEKDTPGQFQLVVNVDPQHQNHSSGKPLKASASKKLVASLQEAPSLGYDVSKLYKTQKSSPPSTPSTPQAESQGWSDLDAIPPEFLDKVAPDWKVTFSRSDSTASTQSRKLADIKARIKKSGKGFVIRLLKGTNADTNEVKEVQLGRDPVEQLPTLSELDSTVLPVELATDLTTNDAPGGVFEIGSSGEPGVERVTQPIIARAVSSIPQWLSQTSSEPGTALSVLEDNLSDAETLLPDVRSVIDRMEDHTDVEPVSNYSSVLPTRSSSVLSIVKTPTRGLTVVGPVRCVEKVNRVRAKGKTARIDLSRTGARKSFIGRSPQGSISEAFVSERLRNAAAAYPPTHTPHSDRSSLDEGSDDSSKKKRNPYKRRTQTDKQELANRKVRRQNSAPDAIPEAQSGTRLRLDTSLAPSRSADTSPATIRKASPRTKKSPTMVRSQAQELPSHARQTDLVEGSPEWSEVDPADAEGIREALEVAFGKVADDLESSPIQSKRIIPSINEPVNDGESGMYTLPPSLEIRSAPAAPKNRFSMFLGLAIGAVLEKVIEGVHHLRDSCGSEPAVPADHVRVRWTCSCGETLYDDFIERRPGAARWLEGYLNRPRAHTPSATHSRSSTSTSMSSIFDHGSRASTLATPSSTYGGPTPWGKNNSNSKYSPTRLKSNSPFSVSIGRPAEDSWLLTCANEGRFTPKIVHLDVNAQRIRSDKDLAIVLREHYKNINRRWMKWIRLRGLTTIEFVQFEIHRNRFADIRATPSMPPTSSSANKNSPSQHPYTFEAVDLIPPVGSHYLLHLFKHPEDYDGELITYLRAPKRRERLEFGMGWGINLVEGFLAQKVWAVIIAGFGVGSAVFAILWTIKKADVQGAFGVAGWLVTLATLVLGALQAWLE
ncbi:hypothetical protein PMIN01_09429 [Paraphaeosphaeria minitans]|uniref:Uncharacterized protein n=1 Tax=Paraphaeosphaeria minitans TaxID=565426 RepID=A0A9P6GCA9_9PLEO|nr:hypothetical protein PMIN01_09429 [Paraphaeosphaeria minitans]